MLFADDRAICNSRRESVESKLEEREEQWKDEDLRLLERRLNAFVAMHGHQYVEMHLQGETVNIVKTLKYMGSPLADY